MNSAFTDDQLALAAAVRDILRVHCPPRAARTGRDRRPGWAQLAGAGFFGLLVPVEYGGRGMGLAGAVLALEETGWAAMPGPVAETMAAAPALLAGEPGLLVGLAAGTTCVSLRLGGQVYVPDADLADVLVLDAGTRPYVLDAADVRLVHQAGMDPVRRLFTAAFEPAAARPVGPGADPVTALRRVTVATAAQLVGTARRLLDLTAAHAGRPAWADTSVAYPAPLRPDHATWKGVMHQLGDVAVAVEFATPLVHRAALAVDEGLPGADREVSAAKAAAGEAAGRAARTALRVHGAIGYAADPDLRLWLARVWSLSAAYGDTALHRARLRDTLLASGPRTRPPAPLPAARTAPDLVSGRQDLPTGREPAV
ncbi:acyl-CoA dehydrogenase [Microtetraspora sp. NBRC 13810]|uniref:acyl-CoA dehydrogenase family protein n=1 Tax=Microtetraspora sp. NBRC 13810 TaxID=3030990 RepID=UPI0024A4D28C|nr:acyl-CoA dehydrogenase family protein [Microtetraspora sp. NBRC 13810]GLW08420.1 acyl-CoA dehydrogenase [Microtetraspora sp. NBRC 13810]